MFIVDKDTRLISTSDTNDYILGCEGDCDAEIKQFQLPRYADTGWDLSTGTIRISYTNANGELGNYTVPADGMTVDADTITVDWLIGSSVCAQEGTVTFGICSILADADDDAVTSAWAAADVVKGSVLAHTCNTDFVPESALADATAAAIAAIEAAGDNYETKTAHEADVNQLNADLTAKVGYAEYEDSYLYLYESSAKSNLIAKLLIEGGGGTGGISEAKCRQIIESYGYATTESLSVYAKSADLATVATSGSYEDLSDKPTIPTQTTVSADQVLTTGTEIGGVTIDGTRTPFFAPSGGSSEDEWELIEAVTISDDTTTSYSRSTMADGTPMNLKKYFLVMQNLSGSSINYGTYFVARLNGLTWQQQIPVTDSLVIQNRAQVSQICDVIDSDIAIFTGTKDTIRVKGETASNGATYSEIKAITSINLVGGSAVAFKTGVKIILYGVRA